MDIVTGFQVNNCREIFRPARQELAYILLGFNLFVLRSDVNGRIGINRSNTEILNSDPDVSLAEKLLHLNLFDVEIIAELCRSLIRRLDLLFSQIAGESSRHHQP